jgi:hypothetical protein
MRSRDPSAAFALFVAFVGVACSASPPGHGGPTNGGASSGSADASTAADAVSPGQDAVVTVFDKALFAFHGAAGGERRRTASGAFPAGGTYERIVLGLQLECPQGGCDHWDRVGSVGIVTEPPVDGGSPGTVVEIARFVTPFGVGAPAWDYDVTDLAPLLTGDLTLQGFIDTWSPQGNPAANGAGWLVTATFTFTGGMPAKTPIANLPIWSWPANSDPPNAPYGDTGDAITNHLSPQTISLPPGASSYALRSFITGHGQGSAGNCAEFCKATHTITVGSQPFAQIPWRACCAPDPACETQPNPTPAQGVAPGQYGTYMYPRSGWCPGASVDPWMQDVTPAIGPGPSATFAYAADSYANACSPSAPACEVSQCAPGVGCAYNGGSHTAPFFYFSSLLVAYK